jgi:hypothetical protein
MALFFLPLFLALVLLAPAGSAQDAAARLDAWAERHADAARPALVLHPRYGLGNRMLSAVSALALALATDRRLFVEWEHPFDGLFESPFPSGWRRPAEDRPTGARTLDLTASSPTFSRLACSAPLSARLPGVCVPIRGRSTQLRAPALSRALAPVHSIAADIACNGAAAVLAEAEVVEISSDQYFLPLLLLHDDSRTRLAAVLGLVPGAPSSGWDGIELERLLVRSLGRWLLRPVETVRHAVAAYERQHFATGTGRPEGSGSRGCSVGIHVRVPMFEFELQQVRFWRS